MMTFRSKKLGLLIFSAFLTSSTFVVAAGNGNGNEPPLKRAKGDSGFFCSILPMFCSIKPMTTEAGNGNGNEPD